MFELKGKYNECKIFTNNVDEDCVRQLISLLNQESLQDSIIRIMPDAHAGAGCVIGTTMTVTDKVIPNLVGIDIGCGMHTVRLKEKRIELPKLDSIIRKNIPSGGSVHDKFNQHQYARRFDIKRLRCIGKSNCKVSEDIAACSMGTLGGGNHFIEVDKDEDGNLYLVVHTGSRRIGKDVAEYYQNRAYEELNCVGTYYKEIEKKDRQEKCERLDLSKLPSIPYEVAYCENELFADYIHDMEVVQEYAFWNRKVIANTILKEMKLHSVEEFETVHNYIDTEYMILRKGAVSARKVEKILIPINMRDGSLLCMGKGNKDWNYSAPHGAGRLMSRSQAKENITLSAFKKTMKEAGVYSTSVTKDTIDESPFAYKPMEEIVENIKDTVEIINVIRPIYNFKASVKE